MPIQIVVDEIRKLNAMGLNDREIGEKLGISKVTVANCRRDNNIPRAGWQIAELIKEYSQKEGLKDAKIGEILKIPKASITQIRHRYGIPRARVASRVIQL